MKIRVYTQYGTDETRAQYAYCSAYYSPLDGGDDGAHIADSGRIWVMSRGSIDDSARQARRAMLRKLENIIGHDLSVTLTIEFHKTQDDAE